MMRPDKTVSFRDPSLKPLPTGMSPAGTLRAPLEAILFDIYGTLFISAAGDLGATTEADPAESQRLEPVLKAFSLDRHPEDLQQSLSQAMAAAHQQLQQQGLAFPEVIIEDIWQHILNWDDPDRIRAFARAYEKATNPTAPMPGLADLLDKIRPSPLAAGLISNAQFYTEDLFVEFSGQPPAADWAEPDLVFYSYRYGRAKPDAHLFEQAAAALAPRKIAPENTLYVGNDMLNDIYPAHLQGFQTALFAGDARSLRLRASDGRCQKLTPDLTLTHLEQLTRLIGSGSNPAMNTNKK